MRIAGVYWYGFGVPFKRRYVTANAASVTRYGAIVFLRSDDGLVGVGEASPVGPGSREQIETIAETLESRSTRLVGGDTSHALLNELGLSGPVHFGLETSLLDMEGKASGGSVAGLLGGHPRPLPVNALIASLDPGEAVEEAVASLAQGFTSLKLKVAQGSPDRDEELVAAVRAAVGAGVRLRLDANQGWNTSVMAIEALQRLSGYDIQYVEQPVPAGDVAGLARVRQSVSIPVAADEAVASMEDLLRVLAAEAADTIIIKAARLEGLYSSLEMAHTAFQRGKSVVVTSSLESGVGVAAGAHLAWALPETSLDQGLATGALLECDLLTRPFLPSKGVLPPLRGPGLGVQVDMALLKEYGIGIRGGTGSEDDWIPGG